MAFDDESADQSRVEPEPRRKREPDAEREQEPAAHDTVPGLFPQPAQATERRSPMPWLLAGLVVILIIGFIIFASHHNRATQLARDAAQAPDPYASQIHIGNLQMSQASNFAGSKLTYIDGQVANAGDRTVTGITVAVTFRNDIGEPPQQQIMPLTLIRTREPYVDTEPVSAEPLKPGQTHDFRLIFDHVTPEWNQQYPTVKVQRVQTR
jgi:Protein of unknown function (DUF2393)